MTHIPWKFFICLKLEDRKSSNQCHQGIFNVLREITITVLQRIQNVTSATNLEGFFGHLYVVIGFTFPVTKETIPKIPVEKDMAQGFLEL